MHRVTLLQMSLAAFFLTGAAASAGSGVGVGDPAPELTVKEWVRGGPVNLAKDSRNKLHLIEFWAVWCPPCKASVPLLTELQKRFEKDLVVVGVTDPDPYRNSPTEIRQFVKQQGTNMNYTVAIDDRGETTGSYLNTNEPVGIPHAFLVTKDGTIAWQGSPLDPELERVVADVIAGRFDVSQAKAKAKLAREIEKRFAAIDFAFQRQNMGAAWDGVVDILRIDPTNEAGLQLLVALYVNEPGHAEGFRKWAVAHIRAHRSNTETMHTLARTLLRIDDLNFRVPDVALQAAKATYDAANGKETRAVEVYARALYEIGAVDRAIAVQRDAVGQAKNGAERKTALGALKFYETCKRLAASVP